MDTTMKAARFIRALNRQTVDKTPVWLMRQAGRYLPEYRALKEQVGDFLTLCTTPELACEITLQPIRRFSVDAAIIFSDILVIPQAMGLGLSFSANHGPVFAKSVRSQKDITQLPTADPQALQCVMEAIALTRRQLPSHIPLIGFAGSPWTVATYMIEGGATKTFRQAKGMLYENPLWLHTLLNRVANVTAGYLSAQMASGADVLMLFDTWGGVLDKASYCEFSLFYMKQVIEQLTPPQGKQVPIIVFTKNGGKHLLEIADSGCQAIGLDWTADLAYAKQQVGDRVALQGNLDPCLLYASPERIQAEVKQCLAVYDGAPGYIVNLGHGMLPDVPVEHVQALIEAVHARSVEHA